MRICDIRLRIDGLILRDGKTVEDVVKEIEGIVETTYPIQVDVDYIENMD